MKLLKKMASSVFSPVPVSRERAVGVSERLAALSTISSSLEYISQHRNLDNGGLNDWEVMRKRPETKSPAIRKFTEMVSGKKATLAIHGARAAVGAGMLLPGNGKWRGVGNLFLAATTTALQSRHRYGTDGSDQVATQVQGVTGLVRLMNNPSARDALMWYLAIQANLSYFASGWVKLTGEKWRDGSALPKVMRTHTYGFGAVYKLTQRYPEMSKVTQHAVLAMECLFPVVYLAGGRMTRPMIGAACGFHLTNAFVMGLGRFATAFPAMHPMIAYTTAPKSHPSVAGRDDRMVRTALALLAGAVTVGSVVAAQRRAEVRSGWPMSRDMTTRYGNVLQYDVGGSQEGDDRPVLVFSHSLAASSEHFSWMLERLAFDLGYPVITYSRAGYSASERKREAPFALQESVDELEDLVRETVAEGRKVVLVGHSLGGELIRRAAPQLGDRLAGVVYLDPSHPDELRRSSKQEKGREFFTKSINDMALHTKLGFGALMSKPRWVGEMPSAYRDKVFAHYADARLWNAAAREWRAVQEDFENFGGELDPVDAPGLVLAAQRTVDIDEEQRRMYRELADAHRKTGHRGEFAVVGQSDHDSLLTDGRHAHTAADLIDGFLSGRGERGVAAHEAERPERAAGTAEDSTGTDGTGE